MPSLWARVDLRAMAIKGYSTFPSDPALQEPHHQIVSCHIQDTHWGWVTPLQRCSLCILQPRLMGPGKNWVESDDNRQLQKKVRFFKIFWREIISLNLIYCLLFLQGWVQSFAILCYVLISYYRGHKLPNVLHYFSFFHSFIIIEENIKKSTIKTKIIYILS